MNSTVRLVEYDMEKTFKEIKELREQGYTADLLYNYRTGNYEIQFYKKNEMTRKTLKIPRNFFKRERLVKAVYD